MRLPLLALCAGLAVPAAAADRRPNVLMLIADDLKPAIGAYGDTSAVTPRLDALAARGTVFLNAACQWPVCGPSRASLLTGLRPESTGVMDLKTRMRDVIPDIVTLPQHFKAAGYVTAGIGKVFDPRCVDSRQEGDAPSWSLPYLESPASSVASAETGKWFFAAVAAEDEAFPDGRIARAGAERLRELAASEEPFFLAIGFKKPHLPFVAPSRYFELHPREDIVLAPYQEETEGNSGYGYWNSNEFRGYDGVPDEGPIPEDVQRDAIRGYRACVSFVDAMAGQVLDALEATGEAGNTIVVLWGDHGFHLGDHGLWGKHTAFEEAIRSPLLVVAPGFRGGNRVVRPAEFTDVFPTLCELAGIEPPPGLQGVSLAPALADPDLNPREASTAIYKSRGALGYSVRTTRWRYIEWISTTRRVTVGRDLFDLESDPEGRRNLAEEPDHAAIVAEHAQLLRAEARGWRLLESTLQGP